MTRADSDPARATATSGRCRTLQLVVSTPIAAAALFPVGNFEARTATSARNRQCSAPATPAARLDSSPVSTTLFSPQVAARLCDPDRAPADCGGPDHLHSTSHAERQNSLAQPNLQNRQTTQRRICESRLGYSARVSHGLSARAHLQALALSIPEEVTVSCASKAGGCHTLPCQPCTGGSATIHRVRDALSARS